MLENVSILAIGLQELNHNYVVFKARVFRISLLFRVVNIVFRVSFIALCALFNGSLPVYSNVKGFFACVVGLQFPFNYIKTQIFQHIIATINSEHISCYI